MEEEYYLTEEQRIQQELNKAEKKKKNRKKAAVVWIILGIIVIGVIGFWIYDATRPVAQRKPVIYLYPEETTEVSVKLDFKGKLTSVYPKYENGWTVTAEKDGTLTDASGKKYNYLFWEGESDVKFDMSEGFCVKGSDTAAFLEEALEKLGLNSREANEFIVYWLPLMEQNNYNVISFQGEAYTDQAKLTVSPEPDTVIRVFMTWYGSRKPVKIPEQVLSAPERTGFTVVEWGGSEIR